MAQKPEVKVEKAVVFDPKLEPMVKKAAKSGGDAGATEKLDKAYLIKLVPTLKFDPKAKEISASCTWTIFEDGGSKLFARLKQSKGSTARATVNPEKISQANLDDTVGAVAEIEVKGIVKALKTIK